MGVFADANDHKRYRELVKQGKSTKVLPDKLYKISDVFDQNEITGRKLDYLGGFINNDQKLVFDINSKGKILFQKCNCEGSERPSVKSMWGCCFSTIGAIKRDIRKAIGRNEINTDIPPLSLFNMCMVSTYAIAAAMIGGMFSHRNHAGR